LPGRSGGFLGDDRPVDLIDCHGVLLVLLIVRFELNRVVELSLHLDLHGHGDLEQQQRGQSGTAACTATAAGRSTRMVNAAKATITTLRTRTPAAPNQAREAPGLSADSRRGFRVGL
jgi:hypothetical protein